MRTPSNTGRNGLSRKHVFISFIIVIAMSFVAYISIIVFGEGTPVQNSAAQLFSHLLMSGFTGLMTLLGVHHISPT